MKQFLLTLIAFAVIEQAFAQQPCSGSPAPCTVLKTDSLCVGTPFTLSLSTTYTASGITYQWQSLMMPTNTVFTSIPGATAATQPTVANNANMQYQTIITCTASAISVTATPATLYRVICTGISEYTNETDFSVYPIPATANLNILVPSAKEYLAIRLYTVYGKEAVITPKPVGNGKWSINVEGLAAGTYLLEVSSQQSRSSKLVVIEK